MEQAEHYCIDPLARVDLAEILALIARKKLLQSCTRRARRARPAILLKPSNTSSTLVGRIPLPVPESLEGGVSGSRIGLAAPSDASAFSVRLASRALDVPQDDFVYKTKSECLQRSTGTDGAFSEMLVAAGWQRVRDRWYLVDRRG